ncbi:MAG: RHS repeat domain-containing protein [Thermodesulfobacteriota bacterium]
MEKRDYLGRIIEVDEYNEADEREAVFSTFYAYDAASDLLTVTDHYGNKTEMIYDTLGRKTRMSDPDMGNRRYEYNRNGVLTGQYLLGEGDAVVESVAFTPDALGRITRRAYLSGGVDKGYVEFHYDTSPENGVGRLHYSEDHRTPATVMAAYEYDSMGRVVKTGKAIGEQSYLIKYQYDVAGKLRSILWPDELGTVTYDYYPKTGLVRNVGYAEFEGYNPSGSVGSIKYGGGVVYTNYGYDPYSLRMTSAQTYTVSEAGILQELEYQYSPAGDVRFIRDNPNQLEAYYNYDSLHRLKQEAPERDPKYPADFVMEYGYDSTHPHAVKTIKRNGASYQFEYDRKGNMTRGWDLSDITAPAVREITFSIDNMAEKIDYTKNGETRTTHLLYDADNSRVRKETTAGTTLYVTREYEIVNGVPVRYIFANNQRIAKITNTGEGEEIHYYHKDHLGSSTIVTDASGNPATGSETTQYMPFGQNRSGNHQTVSNYKFTDQEQDAEIGLYNYRARLYDPILGVFVSADNIWPNYYDPQGLNRYAYARNNPLKYIDPTGHSWDDGEGISGAIGNFCRGVAGLFGGSNSNGSSESGNDNSEGNSSQSVSESIVVCTDIEFKQIDPDLFKKDPERTKWGHYWSEANPRTPDVKSWGLYPEKRVSNYEALTGVRGIVNGVGVFPGGEEDHDPYEGKPADRVYNLEIRNSEMTCEEAKQEMENYAHSFEGSYRIGVDSFAQECQTFQSDMVNHLNEKAQERSRKNE